MISRLFFLAGRHCDIAAALGRDANLEGEGRVGQDAEEVVTNEGVIFSKARTMELMAEPREKSLS